MNTLKEITSNYQKEDLDTRLKKTYASSLKNDEFKKTVNKLKIKDNIAYKYTSKIEQTMNDLNNCSKCKNLCMCQNKVCGMVYYPKQNGDKLEFNYVACKYKKEDIELKDNIKSSFFGMSYEIKIAKMKDIDVKDAKRVKIIKWLKKFYDEYQKDHKLKGLYLHGSFGCGKTYLISALLNELSKNNKTLIIYYPELLRSIKESFNTDDFNERITEIKQSDLLLLDDIGAETVTSWNRDEILGTILQYRMDNKLPTFFTSNLSLNELEEHFILSGKSEEAIKSKRIMERIKQLTDELELISDNRRK